MSNASTISPPELATDLVSFRILVNGETMSGEYRVTALEVDRRVNKLASARLSIADGDPARQNFAISDKDEALVPGGLLEIQLGYHGKTSTVFRGVITRQALRSVRSKKSSLTLHAKDELIRLTSSRNTRTFTDLSDSDIIKRVCEKAGPGIIQLDVASTSVKHPEMVQYAVTDWDFIVSRAEVNSLLVLTDNGRLSIFPPDTAPQPTMTITYGRDVIEFDAELNGSEQLREVESRSWDPGNQSVLESDTGKSPFRQNGQLPIEKIADTFDPKGQRPFHSGGLRSEELQAWSNALILKSRMALSSGRIVVKGMTGITPGQMIQLNGFGKRFNGNVLVTGVRHIYDKAAWETEIQFGLSPQWFQQRHGVMDQPAAGLVPGVHGLQVAVVLSHEDDPDGAFRVRILLPSAENREGVWARIASMDAGKERGLFFRPEEGDEVVVGFMDDDPRFPVILGMLHSSARTAPWQPAEKNNKKGLMTRSKISLQFDDEKKSILLETPAGKKITLNEDGDTIMLADEHANKIVLDKEGISLSSSKDIVFKTASGKISIDGLNVEIRADQKAGIQGTASAELRSSGQTVLKGSVVTIN